jgi:uncharacterized protein DUF2784
MAVDEFWADVLVAIHLAYVGFVVVGLLAIFAGMLFRWQWIRNPWFRWIHLSMILFVAGEAIVDFECPLTTWENTLRYRAWAMKIDPPLPYRIASWSGLLAAPMGNGSLLAWERIWDAWCPAKTSETFVGRCLDRVMFLGADGPSGAMPPWAFTSIYIGFAVVVLATFILAPPRRKKKAAPPVPQQPVETT